MILKAVQIGEEHDTGFVEPGRIAEDMARQRYGGREDFVKRLAVTSREPNQSRRGGRGDRVENAKQGVGITLLIASDQLGIIEIIASYMRTVLGSLRRIMISFWADRSEILTLVADEFLLSALNPSSLTSLPGISSHCR
jgi:hypothetical protein